MIATIDADWCAAHPLPSLRTGLDKDARGELLVIGGSRLVPGATLLTGEAALRVGGGKVRIGTIEAAAIAIGAAFPESAVVALPVADDGEIAAAADKILDGDVLDCDALAIGPGMAASPQLPGLVGTLFDRLADDAPMLLDAGAIAALREKRPDGRRPVLATPHHGELAKLLDRDIEAIAADPERAARDAAERFGVIVVLKNAETIVATPDGERLRYASRAVGLGTAGSGDVLAGAIGGLLARGCDPLTAIGWGVRAHGEAGRLAGVEIAPIGYLARDLLRFLPRLVSASR